MPVSTFTREAHFTRPQVGFRCELQVQLAVGVGAPDDPQNAKTPIALSGGCDAIILPVGATIGRPQNAETKIARFSKAIALFDNNNLHIVAFCVLT